MNTSLHLSGSGRSLKASLNKLSSYNEAIGGDILESLNSIVRSFVKYIKELQKEQSKIQERMAKAIEMLNKEIDKLADDKKNLKKDEMAFLTHRRDSADSKYDNMIEFAQGMKKDTLTHVDSATSTYKNNLSGEKAIGSIEQNIAVSFRG